MAPQCIKVLEITILSAEVLSKLLVAALMLHETMLSMYSLLLIVANASADASADTTADLVFINCLFLFTIWFRTPQDIANE